MSVLLLTTDLMVISKAGTAAARTGTAVQSLASADDLVAKAEEVPQDLIVLDLTMPGVDVGQLVARLRALEVPPATIIAYGPHVQEQLLERARSAGVDEVMPRGRFHAQIDELIARY